MRVFNCNTDEIPEGVVFVGRPSKWGNPFRIGPHGSREEVIEMYRTWLLGNRRLIAHIGELRGKSLACYCHPLPCHANVLMDIANKPDEDDDL